MPRPKTIPQTPLPKAWSTQVKSAVLHVIALAQYALIYSRSWAADGSNQRVRLRAECDRLEQEAALLREEIRIKDLRMTQIEPPRTLSMAARRGRSEAEELAFLRFQ